MEIREAVQEDNEQLLALTKACPMDGLIKLLIDRQPDYFSLLRLKGEFKVFVAISESRIVGAFALVIKRSFLNAQPENIGYLCDLKIHPQFRNTFLAWRLLSTMHNYMQTLGIDFYLCVTAKGNAAVEQLMKGRASIPSAFHAANFNVYQLLPRKKEDNHEFRIEEYSEENRAEAIDLLNTYFKNFQFASFFVSSDNINGDCAWLIRSNDKIVGFLSVIDTSPFKQNIVSRIPLFIKVLLKAFRVVGVIAETPREKSPLKMLYIKYLAYSEQFPEVATALIDRARRYSYTKNYTFLSYGVDERNPLNNIFQKMPKVIFNSSAFVFDFSREKRWAEGSMCHDNFYQV